LLRVNREILIRFLLLALPERERFSKQICVCNSRIERDCSIAINEGAAQFSFAFERKGPARPRLGKSRVQLDSPGSIYDCSIEVLFCLRAMLRLQKFNAQAGSIFMVSILLRLLTNHLSHS